ncbi:MAG: hypothetical protein R3C01_13705 [Planctomycetaceae bacterium]
MRKPKSCHTARAVTMTTAAGRPGATLVEVLMTLLIMGLGVTSVFTLFPLSVVRSIRASQQTNAAMLAQNARELINGGALPMSVPFTAEGTFWFDPYGVAENGTTVGNPDSINRVSSPATSSPTLRDRKIASPDSWVTLVDGLATVGVRDVTYLDTSHDLSAVGQNSRVIVYSDATLATETRELDATTVSGANVTIKGTAPTVPDFSQTGTLRARIENFERRYTWLLSITSDGNGRYQGQCVVFFRRTFLPDDEYTYETTFNYDPTMDDPSKARTVMVDWPTGAPAPGRGDRFFGMRPLAGGKYRGTWYRIVGVNDLGGGTSYELYLDKGFDGVSGSSDNRAMFPRGIVDVFDFGDLHL